MKALHLPTQRIIDASDVSEPDRQGPWRCAWHGCDAALFYTKAFERKAPSGKRSAVGAKFSCFRENTHSSVPHGAPRRAGRESVSTGESRRHVHRLVDVPVPRTQKVAAVGGTSGTTRTQFEYGDPVGGVRGLRAHSESISLRPDIALTEQIRYSGRDYWWKQLAFGPTGGSFAALDSTIRAQFERYRPYYVEGNAKYHAYAVRNAERLELTLVDPTGKDEFELSVYMPNEPIYQRLVASARSGDRFALFSNDAFVKNTGRVALSIESETQIIPIEKD